MYGQGWASCAPDKTMQRYGLKCHRLQVGDVCISLTPRNPQQQQNTSASHPRKRRWSAPDQFLNEQNGPNNPIQRVRE